MAEKHDLVHHPFCEAGRSDAMLTKTEDGYELRFGDDVLSKRVFSSGSIPGKNFIELEITGEEVVAMGEAPILHEFVTPGDFYVPIGEEARSVYEKLGDLLVGDDLEELCAMQEHFSMRGFPECPVPRVTTARHYEGFTGKTGAEPEDSVRCAFVPLWRRGTLRGARRPAQLCAPQDRGCGLRGAGPFSVRVLRRK